MKLLPLLLLCLVATAARAADIQVVLQRQAAACAKSLLEADYATFVGFTPPRVVQRMGGKDAMIARLKAGTEQMKAQGQAFDSVHIGTAAPAFPVQTWLVAYLPMNLVLQVAGGHLKTKAWLLAISEDQGLHWSFVDLSGGIPPDAFFQVFPELAGHVQFPPRSEPTFEPGS